MVILALSANILTLIGIKGTDYSIILTRNFYFLRELFIL